MPKESEFVVDSNGQCFFCMNEIPSFSSAELYPVKLEAGSKTVISSSVSVHSIQCFSRYMDMDMGKVLHEKESIPAYLLAQVKRSVLKVGLCGDCANLTENFSKLYQRLEKIEMELAVYANLIHEKLRKMETPNEFNSIGKLEVAKVLRSEAMEKCSKKLDTTVPRVKFQNLTLKHLKRRKRKYATCSTRNWSENVIKSEGPSEEWPASVQNFSLTTDPIPNDDYDNYENMNHSPDGEDFHPDFSGQWNPQPASASFKDSEVVIKVEKGIDSCYQDPVPPTSLTVPKKSQAIIDPETGICPKEFTTFAGLDGHFKSVHLKVRHKCKVCQQKFKYQSDLTVHVRSIHMGVKFKCNGCEKLFTQKRHLKSHQRKLNCGIAK